MKRFTVFLGLFNSTFAETCCDVSQKSLHSFQGNFPKILFGSLQWTWRKENCQWWRPTYTSYWTAVTYLVDCSHHIVVQNYVWFRCAFLAKLSLSILVSQNCFSLQLMKQREHPHEIQNMGILQSNCLSWQKLWKNLSLIFHIVLRHVGGHAVA